MENDFSSILVSTQPTALIHETTSFKDRVRVTASIRVMVRISFIIRVRVRVRVRVNDRFSSMVGVNGTCRFRARAKGR